MAPVAVPTTGMDDLKIDEPKVEKKVDVNEEEEDDEEEEGEGGETGATGGMPFILINHAINIDILDAKKKKKKKKCMYTCI